MLGKLGSSKSKLGQSKEQALAGTLLARDSGIQVFHLKNRYLHTPAAPSEAGFHLLTPGQIVHLNSARLLYNSEFPAKG